MQEEREFFEEKDTNNDGVMDREEIIAWIFADSDKDQAHEEARHLLSEADVGERVCVLSSLLNKQY